jgi:hypothetical protein
VADASRDAQQLLRLGRQPPQASDHEVDDVVGHHGLADLVQAEGPLARARVETNEPIAVEGAEELAEEERISLRLLQGDLGQGAHAGGLGGERVAKQLQRGALVQGRELDLDDAGARPP